jgi:NTP pyrophosphatase (non-canonical NTP hydrolase)
MQDTIDLIRQWFHDKGIIEKSTPLKQLSKTQEELNELRDELANLNYIKNAELYNGEAHEEVLEIRSRVKLEMGDVFVTLFGVCEMLNLDPAECMDLAYLKISKRNGEMRDGVFVKS